MRKRPFLLFLIVLAAVLGFLFRKNFSPGMVQFSNDSPLGALMADSLSLPEGFTGYWLDLNWVGMEGLSAAPSLTFLWFWLTGPLWFSKTYAIVSVAFLGLAAWFHCRVRKFHPAVCGLTGLAAALNMNAFSNACWGLGSRAILFGLFLIAVAFLHFPMKRHRWLRWVVAGFAVGMGVMDGYDMGAIYSLYVAAYVAFLEIQSGPSVKQGVVKAVQAVGVVALSAALLASYSLVTLVETQLQGTAGSGDRESATPQERQAMETQDWNFATQWSLPKIETLRVIIPGLFGYRMDTPDGGNYWGAVGQTPGQPQSRYSGAGEYAGVFVVLIAIWAFLQSLRKDASPFAAKDRQRIWFWSAAALVSLVLAWGRWAPFYQIVYNLPYLSTIRNPIKYMHLFHACLLILFAYGLQGIWTSSVLPKRPTALTFKMHWANWWQERGGFDRKFVIGIGIVGGFALLTWLLYASSRGELIRHLRASHTQQIPDALIQKMAQFSIREYGLFALFTVASVFALGSLISGWFRGVRAQWACAIIGALLIVDLGRADLPWIQHWNYKEKYAGNPVLEALRKDAHEHRVHYPLVPLPGQYHPMMNLLGNLYRIEWMQHHFKFYNIQSLDIVQMPRAPEDYVAFHQALNPAPPWRPLQNDFGYWIASKRLWDLTNTRYLLSLSTLADSLNKHIESGNPVFRNVLTFTNDFEGNVTTNEIGPYALIENTSALPRAKLFVSWTHVESDSEVLGQLKDPAFQPRHSVLVSDRIQPPAKAYFEDRPEAGAEIVEYEPKRILVETEGDVETLLLMNQNYNPDWNVYVDGEPAPLLRCNFLFQGVRLPPGSHRVEFRFNPPNGMLYVSVAAIVLGLGLVGFLAINRSQFDGGKTDPDDSQG